MKMCILANFSWWEPWHGKFGISYPWEKYQQIGDAIGELSVTIVSLRGCLQSPRQVWKTHSCSCLITTESSDRISSKTVRRSIKEPCEAVGLSLTWTLRELGESIVKMQMCRPKALIASKLQSMNLELSLVTSNIMGASENSEELGELAGFWLNSLLFWHVSIWCSI